jgi:hypothetical protein
MAGKPEGNSAMMAISKKETAATQNARLSLALCAVKETSTQQPLALVFVETV